MKGRSNEKSRIKKSPRVCPKCGSCANNKMEGLTVCLRCGHSKEGDFLTVHSQERLTRPSERDFDGA